MIDVVILGGGRMGTLHARAFDEIGPDARVVGVHDIDREAARTLAERRGVPVLDSLAEAIAAATLVVVATPIEAHRALVQAALAGGKAVLVEKPAVGSAGDAHALRRAGAEHGRPIFVGHSERYNPVFSELRERIGTRAVRELTLERLQPRGRASSHGVALNLAVHDLDLAAVLLGGPILVQHADGDRDELRATVRGRSGTATLHVSQRSTRRSRRIAATLDDGERLEGDLLGSPSSAREEPIVAQARAIVASLLGRTVSAAPATLAEGLAAVEAALALDPSPRLTPQTWP